MEDLTDHFTTPRKTASVDLQDKSVGCLNLKNCSCTKTNEKRKLKSADVTNNGAEAKRSSVNFSETNQNFGRNLTVALTNMNLDFRKIQTAENKNRVFKSILLEDCLKREDERKNYHDAPVRAKSTMSEENLARDLESNGSDPEKETLMSKASTSAYHRRSCEKEKEVTLSCEDDDSPIMCRQVEEVEVLIHSPPKARRSLILKSDCEVKLSRMNRPSIDDVRLPIVKIVRADYAKFSVFDEIIEIGTDFVDSTTMKKSKSGIASRISKNKSAFNNFELSKIQPWKMRVKFVCGTKYRRRRMWESKEKTAERTPRNEVKKQLVVSLQRVLF